MIIITTTHTLKQCVCMRACVNLRNLTNRISFHSIKLEWFCAASDNFNNCFCFTPASDPYAWSEPRHFGGRIRHYNLGIRAGSYNDPTTVSAGILHCGNFALCVPFSPPDFRVGRFLSLCLFCYRVGHG